MPRHDDFKDDDDLDDLDERDDPDSFDADPSSVDTTPCPTCGKHVYEHAQRCPHCHSYISREGAPAARRWPWWIWAGILLALLGSLPWLFFH